LPKGSRERLVGLLDYVEQVVRLDERVAFRLSEYRLPDGTAFAIGESDTRNLPGIHHDVCEEDGSVWLEVMRLARKEPPTPPPHLAEWIVLSADPARLPETRSQRLVTVTAVERDAALSASEVRSDDIVEAPRKRDESPEAPPRYDLTFRLEDRPKVAAAIDSWISGPWAVWATEELPRRRTIALYQQLYKVFQMVEVGGNESPIEVIWGVGVVHWQKDGRIIDRPLLEVRVDLELDDMRGGLIRVRPTSADPAFDLKPYEELGCYGLPQLSDLIRRELQRVAEGEGLSPFVRESFEPILSPAASRLDSEGCYAPDTTNSRIEPDPTRLTVTDQWVLFARPRSQHIVLQDIDRLRKVAENPDKPIGGVAERLVTEPSKITPAGKWAPLDQRIGASVGGGDVPEAHDSSFDVFFPKPFNDDQIEIIRRLKGADGIVVQGPPGTGKTHTIANLICHAMATGERVLVVSRGEAALAVLKDQLPKEVQPLAIAVLSNERQGLRQIESAIREIQAVVEATRPENRRSAIRRMEAEIDGLRKRIAAIDYELDSIAASHLSKIGPRSETPAELAQRVVKGRKAFEWFTDRPKCFASEAGFSEKDIAALAEARCRAGDILDHLDAAVPSPADLPAGDVVRGWHDDLVRAGQLQETASTGPVRTLRITPEGAEKALQLAEVLHSLASTHPRTLDATWAEPFRRSAIKGDNGAWTAVLRERLNEWATLDAERVELARRSVELPLGFLENNDAREAILRAAAAERLWPMFGMGKGAAKALVNSIKLDGASVREDDTNSWRHVAAVVAHTRRRQEATARWQSFSIEVGAPSAPNPKVIVDLARTVLNAADSIYAQSTHLLLVVSGTIALDQLCEDPELCRSVADQIRAAAGAMRLAAVREHVRRTAAQFQRGPDRTSTALRQFFEQAVGNATVPGQKIESIWRSALQRLATLKARVGDFAAIVSLTDLIAKAGAPDWAKRARTEPVLDTDTVLRSDWRDAWDHAAADARLLAIDTRERLAALAREREDSDTRCRKLFAELVRERTFYELDRRLSPSVKSALVEFVRALAKIGKGTGKTAGQHRRAARDAMARCYDAVPCWIMPTWRVAEQLPADLGALDLVIIDEASQSDVTELPALLRGRKILVVGDDRQVSPTAPFVTQAKIAQLRHHYLGELPFKNLLEPGESIYDLMRAVFPNERLMLKEHFRCVEPIIRFSMQFYPEKMLPLRVPTVQERLDPPLVDIYLPHGAREKHRKINRAEADVIVEEIKSLTAQPGMRNRSIGVISLIGHQQAEYVRAKLSETIGEELMQRHAILCGDSATFQGTERDIVFLSMVADPVHRTALTMLRYEQRFNVAISRGRDRVVLVRSVRREDLNPSDLKARLIAHFENPMPLETVSAGEGLAACESGFERDLMQRLLDRGYRVQPQVGSLGFRIDLVVEGFNGRRLAVECDGDRFHGPEQWREDMRRQRILERVGWRFWRCFASSFYRDCDGVTADLFETLSRLGIEPMPKDESARSSRYVTEHRVIGPPEEASRSHHSDTEVLKKQAQTDSVDGHAGLRDGIGLGDKIVLLFSDDQRRISLRLTEASHDLEKGLLSSTSVLGKAIKGAEEGDEIEFEQDDGRRRKALIESVDKGFMPAGIGQQKGHFVNGGVTQASHF
jgi:very-short-patch-repair endonuclease/transcription elongation GreA/GreB family factor